RFGIICGSLVKDGCNASRHCVNALVVQPVLFYLALSFPPCLRLRFCLAFEDALPHDGRRERPCRPSLRSMAFFLPRAQRLLRRQLWFLSAHARTPFVKLPERTCS